MNSIEEIKARLKSATARPWSWEKCRRLDGTYAGAEILHFRSEDDWTSVGTTEEYADAEFIARAPEDISLLIKVVEAVIELADTYEMTAGMIQHALRDKTLLAAASRDIHNTIAAALEAKP